MALRQALAGRSRGVAVVPPPGYSVLRSTETETLPGELMVAEGSLQASEPAA
jgi:hypothetical protein